MLGSAAGDRNLQARSPDTSLTLERRAAKTDVLGHGAQPDNRLRSEVQCDARPDNENNHPHDAVL